MYSASAFGAVALRHNFNSPELGLVVFWCYKVYVLSFRQWTSVYRHRGCETLSMLSLQGKRKYPVYRGMFSSSLANQYQCYSLVAAIPFPPVSLVGEHWKEAELPVVQWRYTTREHLVAMAAYCFKRFCSSPAWERKIQYSGGLLCHICFAAAWITHGS